MLHKRYYICCVFFSQLNVRASSPGCQDFQSIRYHNCHLLPVDNICGCDCGNNYGLHYPSWWSSTEGEHWRGWKAHHELCRCTAWLNPVTTFILLVSAGNILYITAWGTVAWGLVMSVRMNILFKLRKSKFQKLIFKLSDVYTGCF